MTARPRQAGRPGRAPRDKAGRPPRASQREGAGTEEPARAGAGVPVAAIGALVITLAILTAARALLALVPAMWGWGMNVMRFLPPLAAWVPWSLSALALIPAFSRALVPSFTRFGGAIARARWAGWLVALLAAAMVWALPDRVRFVGDFLLRQGALMVGAPMGTLIPQALPLDLLLHYRLPITLASAGLVDAGTAARLLGALDAALLALLAVTFTRGLGLGGIAAFATWAVVFCGGYLALFTGYSKAFVELSVITAAVGVFGIRVLKQGRGLFPLGLALAAGFLLHRSALALLPAAAWAWVVWLRRHRERGAWKRPEAIAGFALPLVALAVVLPRVVETVFGFDATMHVLRSDVPGQSGWRTLLEGTQLADMLNVILMLSPLALAIPPLAWALRGKLGDEIGYLALLSGPWLLILAVVRPLQGLQRDWDVVAAGGVALSLLAATLIGEMLRGAAGRNAWLGVAVTLAVAMPALQWLLHNADAERGLERAAAFATEAPRRSDRDRGATWDYIGIRNLGLQRWREAAAAFTRATETTPSPRVLMELAYAEVRTGDLPAAQQVYRRLLEKTPEDLKAWEELAMVSMRLGDREESRRAASELLRRAPRNRVAARILARLAAEDSLGSGAGR